MDTVTLFGNTNLGMVRQNNEDAFIAQYIWDNKHVLAVAIDGVGGYEGGEIASSLAQKSIVEYLETYSNGERLELLKQAVIFANNKIFTERKNQPQYRSMSCVLTAILVETEEKRINMAHVGDTRLYQFSDNMLVKLSHDHSLVGYREEIGELTEEEAMKHPQRNIIGRDVGSQYLENSVSDYVEVETFPLLPNSILLLCSDGLCDMITSEQMKVELEKELPVQEKVNNLIAAANEAGGKDNVTVVLVESNNPDCMSTEENLVISQIEPEVQNTTTSAVDNPGKTKRILPSFRIVALVGVPVMLLVAGYFLGAYTGHKAFPDIFTDEYKEDSLIIKQKDSLIVELKKDTAELHKTILQKDTLIDIFQNTLGYE